MNMRVQSLAIPVIVLTVLIGLKENGTRVKETRDAAFAQAEPARLAKLEDERITTQACYMRIIACAYRSTQHFNKHGPKREDMTLDQLKVLMTRYEATKAACEQNNDGYYDNARAECIKYKTKR